MQWCSVVRVAVMDIGIVRMCVHHWLVSMVVRMRRRICYLRIARCMDVLMMLVMYVRMVVLHRFVPVLMVMALCEM